MHSDGNILGASIFVSIKVMAMKKVNCEFVCHFKQNLLLRICLLSLNSHRKYFKCNVNCNGTKTQQPTIGSND